MIAEFNCREAELVTYGLLVARHHDDAPLNLFAFVVQTLAQARGRSTARIPRQLDSIVADYRGFVHGG
ncbi:hypothetical protein [Embleya sp. MST-111070]|uniref:hypothetical protein n=1 Tax=Embleya sp. MST-111070 TaxID=3398231 RepID=UPI003F73A590